MTAIKHRESYIIDLSLVQNFHDALQLLEEELGELRFKMVEPGSPTGNALSINVGELVLPPASMNRLKGVLANHGYGLETLYAKAPQTQQSALSEGYLVRSEPDLSQPEKPYATRPSVDLPFETKLDEGMQATQKSQLEALSSKWSEQIEALFQKVDHIKDDLPEVSHLEHTETKTEPALTKESNIEVNTEINTTVSSPETIEFSAQPMSVMVSDKVGEALPQPKAEITETVLYRHSLRSGQVLKTAGNVVITGDVHAGAEVIAGGDILVWGSLSGNAWAGAPIEGLAARSYYTIRAFRMEPLQLRIGALMARRPDRLFKEDFQQVVQSPSGQLLPKVEVARVVNQESQIFEDQLHAS